MYSYFCSFIFFSFFFWSFSVYKMQICFGFKNIFFILFKHKLHAGQILNFGRYLSKHPETLEIDWNYPKFFQSEIGIPWKNSWSRHWRPLGDLNPDPYPYTPQLLILMEWPSRQGCEMVSKFLTYFDMFIVLFSSFSNTSKPSDTEITPKISQARWWYALPLQY